MPQTTSLEIAGEMSLSSAIGTDIPAPGEERRHSPVLVVGCRESGAEAIHSQLLAWDVPAALVSTGPSALTALRAAALRGLPYSLVIIDLAYPEIEGLGLGRAIKADPAVNGAKLILLTSGNEQFSPAQLEDAGVSECRSRSMMPPIPGGNSTAAPAHNSTPVNDGAGDSSPPPTRRAGRILVAEDNVVNQNIAVGQLRRLGYDADTAGNGREALDAFRAKSYDIILMDCLMPEMDGFDAARAIRKGEGSDIRPWIIAVTADAMSGAREACIAAGMNDYITKPVRIKDIQEALDRAWRQILR